MVRPAARVGLYMVPEMIAKKIIKIAKTGIHDPTQIAARVIMVGGCGRPGASRGVLSFSLRSPLTEPPS
jgi:hypothetical protein